MWLSLMARDRIRVMEDGRIRVPCCDWFLHAVMFVYRVVELVAVIALDGDREDVASGMSTTDIEFEVVSSLVHARGDGGSEAVLVMGLSVW